MTTFTLPLRASGPDKTNIGDVILAQTNNITFNDTTAKVLFTLPAPARIIDFYVDVDEVFNAGTGNLLDLGVTGTPNLFANDLNVASLGRLLGSSDASQIGNYQRTAVTEVIGTYVPTGAAATTGNALITVAYVSAVNLPA